MSVRKRTWFTNLQRKKIDPKAKEIAIIKGVPDDWKEYIDRAAELLGIQPQEKWIVDYAVNGSRHLKTFERKVAQSSQNTSSRMHSRENLTLAGWPIARFCI